MFSNKVMEVQLPSNAFTVSCYKILYRKKIPKIFLNYHSPPPKKYLFFPHVLSTYLIYLLFPPVFFSLLFPIIIQRFVSVYSTSRMLVFALRILPQQYFDRLADKSFPADGDSPNIFFFFYFLKYNYSANKSNISRTRCVFWRCIIACGQICVLQI